MSCKHCKNAVEEAVNSLEGVESAEVDLDGETVAISYDDQKLGVEELKGNITEAGPYEVE
jgi:copper chaperone CopZ